MYLKSLKYHISFFFIALCTLYLIGHEVIPHHHHFDTVYSHQHGHSDAEDNQHHEDQSTHCHAFNDSMSDKLATNIQQDMIQVAILDLLSHYYLFDCPVLKITSHFILEDDCLPEKPSYFNKTPLRAPPHTT